jgi:hypothetical protein
MSAPILRTAANNTVSGDNGTIFNKLPDLPESSGGQYTS